MNDFNPVRYTLEMKIIGFGLVIVGAVALASVVISRVYNRRAHRRG